MANENHTFESPAIQFLPIAATRAQLVEQARKYLGCNYSLRGSWVGWQEDGSLHPASKVDCVRLLLYVARDLGLLPPDFDVNGPRPHEPGARPLPRDAWLMALLEANFDAVDKHQCRAGDVLLFWYHDHYHIALASEDIVMECRIIEARDMDAGGTGKVVEICIHADEWNSVCSAWALKAGLSVTVNETGPSEAGTK